MATLDWSAFDEEPASDDGLDWSAFDRVPTREEEPSFTDDLGTSLKSGGYSTLKVFGDLYGLATGNMDNWASTTGSQAMERLDTEKSLELKGLEEGRRAAIDNADGELAKAGAAIWETVSSPTLFANFIAEQLPMLLPIGAAGRGAQAVTKLAGATAGTARGVGTGAAIGTGAGMQTGDVTGSAYEQIINLPDELWDQNPEYVALRDQIGTEEAKKQIALERARAVAPAVAGISVVSQALPGGATIERALAGTVGKSAAKSLGGKIAKGALGEAAQEAVEEGSGAALGNVAVQAVDPAQEITEGVGEAAGLGAIGGGVLGGALGAVSGQEEAQAEAFSKLQKVQQASTVEEAINAASELASHNQSVIDQVFSTDEAVGVQTEYPAAEPFVPRTPQEADEYINNLFQETGTSTLSGEALDQALAEELRAAEGITDADNAQVKVASSTVGSPQNTQLADELVGSGVAERNVQSRTLGETIKPKSGFYRSQQAAEHALRGKLQTTRTDRLAELSEFEAAETEPGSGQWQLVRRQAPAAVEETGARPTQVVVPDAERTVSRAEVLTSLRRAGMTDVAKQRQIMDGLQPVSEEERHTFNLENVRKQFAKYQLGTEGGEPVIETGLKPAVEEAFPSGKVETMESGAQRVSLPNGSVVTVLPDQTIEVSKPAARKAYEARYKGQEKASGAFLRVGEDGVIWLSKEADQGTVDHEAFHMAFQTALTNKERSVLVKKYGSEEEAAAEYGRWKPAQKNGVFEKIRKFFRAIREALFGPTAEGTLERVAEGKVFERKPEPVEREPVGEPTYELQEEAAVESAPEPTGTPLRRLRVQIEDDSGRKASIRADQALQAIDDRIEALEQLKRCL